MPGPKPDVRASRRHEFLDVVRGIAALAVVVEHACENCVAGYGTFTQKYFHLGPYLLPLFMLVSGFVVSASLERKGSLRQFWTARALRLYPLYWINLLMLVALYRVTPSMTAFDPLRWQHWLANATMFQEVLQAPHANPVYWTLTIEMACYVLLSLFFVFGVADRTVAIAWWSVAAFGLGGTVLPLVFHLRFPAGYAFLVLTFQIGALFRRIETGDVPRRTLAAIAAALLTSAAAAAYLNFEWMPRQGVRFSFLSVYGAWAASLATFASLYAWRCPMPQALVGLGTISYSVYLLHPLVLHVMPANLSMPIYLASVVAAILSLSTLTYWAIERPFIRLGRTLTRATTRRAPSSARLAAAA